MTQGLKVLAEFAGTLGATDLRAGSAALGADLAKAGLRLSLEGGSARSVLVRAEQWRAASLRRAPVRPERSGQLAELLARLRYVTTQATDDALVGKDIRALQRDAGQARGGDQGTGPAHAGDPGRRRNPRSISGP